MTPATKPNEVTLPWPPQRPEPQRSPALGRQAPSKAPVMLPAPTVNPEIAAKVLEGLKAAPVERIDHKAWAKRILRDVQGGLRRSPAVVQMARNALEVKA